MKRILGAALMTLLFALPAAAQNLVVNGSFEQPHLGGGWTVLWSIPGWTTVSGPGIEIQTKDLWPAMDGDQMVELDSHGSSAMVQTVFTQPGSVYELNVGFSPRPGIWDNRIGVYWNGTLVSVLDGRGDGSTRWSNYSFRVTASGATSELKFADLSYNDSLGGLIDNVSLVALDSDGDGVLDGDDRCEGTTMPELAPTESLGVNRFALVDGDGTFDTQLPSGKGPRRIYTLQDTAGCSCEQIVAAMGLGDGHLKFGCSVGVMNEWVQSVHH